MASQIQLTHRQHKVPQWHLRNFVDTNGDLWCYSRNAMPKARKPKSVCWARDYYEYELNGYTTRNDYELWLGQIENDASLKCEDLLASRQLGQRDAVIWATYVASLFVRSSKCRGQIVSSMTPKFREETTSPDFIRERQYSLLKKGFLVPEEEVRKLVESRRAAMESSASYYHLAAIKETTASLAEAVMKKTWHTLEAPSSLPLLLGDCPVTTVQFEGNHVLPGPGFNNENAAIMVPMTPHRLFIASPPARHWSAMMQLQQVSAVNLLTVRFAEDAVFSNLNKPETQDLVKAEINQIAFGRDAFVPRN